MFERARIFLFVFLFGSVCQAPAPSRRNSSKQCSETEPEQSGSWIVNVFKRMYKGAKEWAFGDDGFITNLVVKTGDGSTSSPSSGQCCCCCHKKPNSDSNFQSNNNEIRCCSIEGAKECLSLAWERKGDRCEDCCLGIVVCCQYCVGKPCYVSCKGLEKCFCNDPMVDFYCGAKKVIEYPFKKIRQCACRND